MPNLSKAITAQNVWTDPVSVNAPESARGNDFNVSIWGTFVATVTVQRSFDQGATWLDVASYTAPIEDIGFEPEAAMYRIGVKTGGFTSGTVNVRIGA